MLNVDCLEVCRAPFGESGISMAAFWVEQAPRVPTKPTAPLFFLCCNATRLVDKPPTPMPSFWRDTYLPAHARPLTRWLHYAGTLAAVGVAAAACVRRSRGLAAAALVAGYGPAWLAHALVERNRPATFRAPIASLVSDFRMLYCAATGRLGRELRAAGVAT